MKILERLRTEWLDFIILVRNVFCLCKRKMRNEDFSQERSQIRILLPKTRCPQAIICLVALLLAFLLRIGCDAEVGKPSVSHGTGPAQSNPIAKIDHILNVGKGLEADRQDSAKAEIRKRELRKQIEQKMKCLEELDERLKPYPSIRLLSGDLYPTSNSIWRVGYEDCIKGDPYKFSEEQRLDERVIYKFKDNENPVPRIMRNGTLASIYAIDPPPPNYMYLPGNIAVLNVPYPRGLGYYYENPDVYYLPVGYYRATGTYLEDIRWTLVLAEELEQARISPKDAPTPQQMKFTVKLSRIYLFEKLDEETLASIQNREKEEVNALRQKYTKEIVELKDEIKQTDVWLVERFAANAAAQKKAEEFAVSHLSKIDLSGVWKNMRVSKAVCERIADVQILKDYAVLRDMQKKAAWKQMLAFAAGKFGVSNVSDSEYPTPEKTEEIIKRIMTPVLSSDMFPLDQVSLVVVSSTRAETHVREMSDDRKIEITLIGDEVVYNERSTVGDINLKVDLNGEFSCRSNMITWHGGVESKTRRESLGDGVTIDVANEKFYICEKHTGLEDVHKMTDKFLGENRQFNPQVEQKKENSAFALRLRQVTNSSLSSLAVE